MSPLCDMSSNSACHLSPNFASDSLDIYVVKNV